MATNYSPRVVTRDLILCLDAANPDSYPRSGNIWNDLASSNNGTLTNGPVFNSANGGSIVFDGIDDNINITNNTAYRFANTQPFSIGVWTKCTSLLATSHGLVSFALDNGAGYYIALFNGYKTNSFFFDYWDGNAFRGILGEDNSITLNSWVYLTATSSSNSVNDMKFYQNGKLTAYTVRGNGTPNTVDYNNVPLRIGSRGNSYYYNGSIATVQIYNRALTQDEVLQNYNATKGRFNI